MSQSSFDSGNITELLSGRMCLHSLHLKSQLNLVYFIKFLMLKTFNPLTTNDWGSFDKGALCVCVFTSIHREGFICLGLEFQVTDVVLKTFLSSAKSLLCYFSMKH